MQQKKEHKLNKPAGRRKKEGKNEKNGSWLQNLFLIFIILILTSAILMASIFFFNIGGGKPIIAKAISKVPLIGNIVKPIIENKTPEEIEEEELQLKRDEIALQNKVLEEKEKELQAREKDITKQEEWLKEKEKDINEKYEQLNERLNSIYEQVEYFEKMNPANASQILSNMDSKGTVTQILRNMDKSKSSKILSLMDPLQAAQILEDIRESDRLDILSDQ